MSLPQFVRLLRVAGFSAVQTEPFLVDGKMTRPDATGTFGAEIGVPVDAIGSRWNPPVSRWMTLQVHVEPCQIPLPSLYFCSMHCTVYCTAS